MDPSPTPSRAPAVTLHAGARLALAIRLASRLRSSRSHSRSASTGMPRQEPEVVEQRSHVVQLLRVEPNVVGRLLVDAAHTATSPPAALAIAHPLRYLHPKPGTTLRRATAAAAASPGYSSNARRCPLLASGSGATGTRHGSTSLRRPMRRSAPIVVNRRSSGVCHPSSTSRPSRARCCDCGRHRPERTQAGRPAAKAAAMLKTPGTWGATWGRHTEPCRLPSQALP